MDSMRQARGSFDITSRARPRRSIWIGLAAFVAASATAQVLDSTIDDVVTNEIDQQVEDQLAETLAGSVEQQVEADVAASVEQQVEADVAASVEQQVEADVATSVEQQVEADVAASVEQQVEADVATSVEQQVEADVATSVEQQVAKDVAASVEQQVEKDVAASVEQEIEAGVAASVEQQVETDLTTTVEQSLETQIDDVVSGTLEDVGEAVDGVDDALGEGSGGVLGGGDPRDGDGASADSEGRSAATERYVAGLDANGRAIERDVWIILVPDEYAGRIQGWGFSVRERRDLDAMGRVLLRVDAPEDRDIAQAALDLALDAPGTRVDFNHVYREDDDTGAAVHTVAASAAPRVAVTRGPSAGTVAIGMLDSAVEAGHEAFVGAEIVQRDFVPFAGARPTRHGTAVASVLAGESTDARDSPGRVQLYAASVFFEDEDGNMGATTASLVAGLEWLTAQGLRVVNMSLSGPPNGVLEAAVTAAAARGVVAVAAVGNNGPAGKPLYPAAYEPVVGVTAVDASNRIYRHANRGPHVMFSAPGVEVRVARSGGSYGFESGTSLAAPYAAAIIAESLATRATEPVSSVLSSLQTGAIDLGRKNFDEIFGFGLIAALGPRP